ncbi:Rho GTPase-activating protein 27 [Amphibalanus amphitrite]|uniref:Rho GTPase-activating protein 27 n=1 Tax=Amphibalanus amphitrite TaxID=1232801 RepID=A0A6A4WFF6_AMPAM|nr:Rho GTPase-activating protein 27 [Amphibalanus amphitrite]
MAPSMDRDLVVTVLFDFEYHSSDGQRVHMHKDEEFLVIQQTNSDWWQVIRSGERKPFYAPTQYLKVQPRPRPQLPPKVKPVKRNARDSRRAPLSITDAERHISCEDDAPGDETPGRRRCNSLEDAAAGSSSVETLDDSPPAPVSRPAPGGTPQATELPAAAGGQSDATPGRGATPRLPPSRHRRPRISKDLWARRKSWSVDERSRTWELTSYDRSLQSFSTFSNLRSARIDLAGHNASFKRTAERLRRPPDREADRSRRPTAGRQVEPPRVDGPPRPPVPPKTLQLRLQPAADGLPTTPDDGDWSDSEPAGSESESGSWERLDQMKAALYFANPLMPRSGLSRSADHLPVPLPRTRLTEISPPQSRQPPPVPHILETPIRSLHDGWGEYLHHGRKYYYNVDTQSSTWKPPRRNVKSPATSPDKSVSDPSRPTAEAGTPVLEVDVPLVPLPPGWRRRVDSTGELCYVRDSSPTRGVSDTTRLV